MREFFAKSSKLLLSLMLVAALGLVLVGCNKTSEDETNLDAAYTALILGDTGAVTGNLDLPTTGMNNASITWSSSNEAVVAPDGTVTRPAPGAGNVTVTLTATLTIGEYSKSKEFTVTVVEDVESSGFDSIADLQANSTLGDPVEITGVVYFMVSGGYFITDGTNGLSVYAPGLQATVGDEVTIKGTYAVYNSTYQIGVDSNGGISETIISSNNPITMPKETLTVAQAYALDSTDKLTAGKLFDITGLVTVEGSYENVYLVDGDSKIMINYYSLADSIDALKTYVGQVVTIEAEYYTNHGTNGPMISFQGGVNDVTVVTLDDTQKVANIGTWLATQIPASTTQDLTLPATDSNYGSTITWETSDADYLTNAGVVTIPNVDTTVTLTATVVLNDVTETFTFDVTVKANPETIASVFANHAKGDEIYIQGIIFGIFYYGYYVNDGTGNMYVYVGADGDKPDVGTEVKIVGGYDIYYGQPELAGPTSVEVVSTGNDPLEPTDSSIADIVAADTSDLSFFGSYLTVTGTVVSHDGDTWIQDGDGNEIMVYYRSNVDAVSAYEGQQITLSVIFYTYYSSDGSFRVLYTGDDSGIVVNELTDAEKLDAAAAAISLPAETYDDIVLPLTGANDVVISWATDNPDVLGADGTVGTVTEDTDVVLTATLTLGDLTITQDFTVSVLAPLTVSTVNDAILAVTDTTLKIQGVVTAVIPYDSTFIIEDADGTAIYIDDYKLDSSIDLSTLGIAVGDKVEVVGDKGFYRIPLIDTVQSITVLESGQTLAAATPVTDLAAFRALTDDSTVGKTYSFTDVSVLAVSSSSITIYDDGADSKIVISISDSTSDFDFTTIEVGDVMSFTATFYRAGDTFTDATTWYLTIQDATTVSIAQ